jgi:hypothetical protein
MSLESKDRNGIVGPLADKNFEVNNGKTVVKKTFVAFK